VLDHSAVQAADSAPRGAVVTTRRVRPPARSGSATLSCVSAIRTPRIRARPHLTQG